MEVRDIVEKYMRDYGYTQLKSKKKDCSCHIDAIEKGLFHCFSGMAGCSFYPKERMLNHLFPADIGEISIRKLVRKFMRINGLVGLVESTFDPDCGCSIEGEEAKLFECGYREYPKEIYCKITK